MKTFLTYRIAATLQLLIFFFIAVLSFQPKKFLPKDVPEAAKEHEWPAYFGMPVLMLMIITLLNDGTLISVGYDYTFPSLRPEKWNIKALFLISSYLGAISFLSSLLLLFFMLDSWREGSFFQQIKLGGLEYGQIINAIYLKVSVSDFLTLFAARAQEKYFWSITPHPILAIAGGVSLTIATLLALLWPAGKLDSIPVLGLALREPYDLALWVWIYCIFVFLIQDFGKTYLFAYLYKHNVFNILAVDGHKEAKPVKDETPLPFTFAGKIAANITNISSKE